MHDRERPRTARTLPPSSRSGSPAAPPDGARAPCPRAKLGASGRRNLAGVFGTEAPPPSKPTCRCVMSKKQPATLTRAQLCATTEDANL
jgi:hypothetical protein